MERNATSGIMSILLLMGMLVLAFNIQTVKTYPKTIYVNDDNTAGPWDGTLENPYQNITSGLENASAGDTIYVNNGTYYENVVVNKDNLTLIGENKYATIVDGNDGNGFGIAFSLTASNVNITGFTIQNSGGIGIRGELGNGGIIFDNIVSNCSSGIIFGWANITITGNEITNCTGTGIELNWNNTVTENIVTNNYVGFKLFGGGNVLRNNVMANNQFNFGHDSPTFAWHTFDISYFINDIDTSNSVDGKPIYYWINQHNETVPNNAGYIELVNCSNIVIENLTISKNVVGILLANSKNILLSNLSVTQIYNFAVVLAIGSSHNKIINSNIVQNGAWGVYLSGKPSFVSENNTISKNNITSNHFGIQLWSADHNEISDNSISNNGWGIVIRSSIENRILQNDIANYGYGIFLDSTLNNSIYHNNFINNKEQVYVSTPSLDIWDDGYPSGGNYWSNYTGIDIMSGPNQDQLGSDGIGDTPHVIDAENQDNYPLMNPYIAGDVDYNGIVNGSDLYAFSKAYGAMPDSPDWNVRADINDDLIVDVIDLFTLGKNFGKTGP